MSSPSTEVARPLAVRKRGQGPRDGALLIARPPDQPDPAAGAAKNLKALRALRRALRAEPRSIENRLRSSAVLRYFDALDLALAQCQAALRLDPRSLRALQARCEIEWGMGMTREARKSLRAALRQAPRSAEARLWAGERLIDMSDFEGAAREARAAVRVDCGSAQARLSLGRLCLWRGEARQARRQADQTLALDSSLPAALRLRGAAKVLEGEHAAGLKDLDAALSLAPEDAEALTWRGEAERELGRFSEARTRFEAALGLGGQPLGAMVNLAILKLATGAEVAHAEYSLILSRFPRPLVGMGTRLPHPLVPSREVLERILKVLGGNRTNRSTFLVKARGRTALRDHIHYFPRDIPLHLQAKIRFGHAELVLREFDRMISREPKEAYLHASRGEVLLWVGRYKEAMRDIRRALRLDPDLPWPNIGLCAAQAMLGRHRKAVGYLPFAERNSASPGAIVAWRGHVHRRLGDSRNARHILRTAQEVFPARPGLWIDLALAKGALGDAKGQRRLFDRLRGRLPGFFADAAREAGAAPGPRRLSDRTVKKVLEKALEMLRGNRSSWMYTYVDGRRRVRHIKLSPGPVPPSLAGCPWAVEHPGVREELEAWRKAFGGRVR